MQKHHKIYIFISTILLACCSYYLFLPAEVEREEDVDDTGKTREETEQFMREIGYVQ